MRILNYYGVSFLSSFFYYNFGGAIISKQEVLINNQIRAKEIRVIDVDGTQLGVMGVKEALEIAESKGTDLIEILRYGKMSYTCEFNSSSTWAHRFAELSETDIINLSCYDLKADAAVSRRVRMRDFKAVLVNNSQRIEGIKGLYKVTFKLEEF